MAITTVLTINGTTYSAAQRAAARVKPDSLTRNLHNAHDVLAFHEVAQSPFPGWDEWTPVSATVNGTLRFSGRIVDTQSQHGHLGWSHGYTCYSIRYLVDKLVPCEAIDGSGTVVYNRPPTDTDYYLSSDSGLSVGAIVTRVLTVPATATRIQAITGGTFTGLGPPTLPAATVADLAAITVVPAQAVQFSGGNILSAIESLLARWCPRFVLDLQPTGVLRFPDTSDVTTAFAPRTITLASEHGAGDPVYGLPRVRRTSADCATRVLVRGGPKVEAAQLSLVDGTLAEVFTPTDKSNWTLYYFTSPKGSADYGTITAMTSTSATLLSHDATVTWATNFWSTNHATITLIDPVATGINEIESHTVTANASMSAGGTASVSWDAAVPAASAVYTMYRIIGQAGGLIDTWRTYAPREIATGNTGLLTYVGSRLVKRSSRPVAWSNAVRSFSSYTTQASVVGPLGVMVPAVVEPVPSQGIFRFAQPTVTYFGQTSKLNLGSPTTVADGLPADVQVVALYSRGPLTAAYPADVTGVAQYSGTAAAFLSVTEYIDVSSWDWYGDTASMTTLAQEHQLTVRDVEYDLSVSWDVDGTGAEPGWDYMGLRYSLNLAIAGTTSPWSAIKAVCKTVQIDWNTDGAGMPGRHRITFHATTKKRAFSGDDLYIHPRFTGVTGVGGGGDGGVGETLLGMLTDPSINRDATADYMAGQNALLENNPGANMSFDSMGIDMSAPAAGGRNEQLDRARFATQVKDQAEANQRLKGGGDGLPGGVGANTPEGIIARTSDAGGQEAGRQQGLQQTQAARQSQQAAAEKPAANTPEALIAQTQGTPQQGDREKGLAETRQAQRARADEEQRKQAARETPLDNTGSGD